MELPDLHAQTKIWQRVRSEQPPVTDGLQSLVAGAMTQAAVFGSLSRQVQGPGRELLLQLRDQELSHARCMKGIYVMVTGKPMAVTAAPVTKELPEIALRKAYGRSLRALKAYEEKAGREEYGPVFELLAAGQRENCRKIAEITGLVCV